MVGRYAKRILTKHANGFYFGKRFSVNGQQDATVLFAALKDASDALRAWLRYAIPIERELRLELDEASQAVAIAEHQASAARSEQEWLAAQEAVAAARQRQRDAEFAWDNSEEAYEVNQLRKTWPRIDTWRETGILTLPLGVVARLSEGFGWGGEWDLSKDICTSSSTQRTARARRCRRSRARCPTT